VSESDRDTLRIALRANGELLEKNRKLRARVRYLEKRDHSRATVAGIQRRQLSRCLFLPWRGFVS
jgi:hypothetical protein